MSDCDDSCSPTTDTMLQRNSFSRGLYLALAPSPTPRSPGGVSSPTISDSSASARSFAAPIITGCAEYRVPEHNEDEETDEYQIAEWEVAHGESAGAPPSGRPPYRVVNKHLRRTSNNSNRSSTSTSDAGDSDSDDMMPDAIQSLKNLEIVDDSKRRKPRPRSSEFGRHQVTSPPGYSSVRVRPASTRYARALDFEDMPDMGDDGRSSHPNAFSSQHVIRAPEFRDKKFGDEKEDADYISANSKTLVKRVSGKSVWRLSRSGIQSHGSTSDPRLDTSPILQSTSTSSLNGKDSISDHQSPASLPKLPSVLQPRAEDDSNSGTLFQLINSLINNSQNIADVRQFILAKESFTNSLELFTYIAELFQNRPLDSPGSTGSLPTTPTSSSGSATSTTASAGHSYSLQGHAGSASSGRSSILSSSNPYSSAASAAGSLPSPASSASSEHSQGQIRIINFLKKWLTTCPKDFDEKSIASAFYYFLEQLTQSPETVMWARILETCWKMSRTSYSSMRSVIKGKTEHEDAPSTNANPYLLKAEAQYAAEPSSWRLLEPDSLPLEEFARQWTLIDHFRFSKVRISELQRGRWEKPELAPRVANINTHFNRCTRWVASEILKGSTPKQRAKTIQFMIALADQLLSMRNFFGTMVFVVGLQQAAISRLSASWDKVNSASSDKWKSLSQLSNPVQNFRKLRSLQEHAAASPEPFILSTVLLFRDLYFISEGNTDWTDEKQQFINFDKLQLEGRVLESVFLSQSTPYPYKHIKLIKKYISHLPNFEEDELLPKSRSIEPNS